MKPVVLFVATVHAALGALAAVVVPCAVISGFNPAFLAFAPAGAWGGWRYAVWQMENRYQR